MKWSFISVMLVSITFMSIIFLSAFINLKEDEQVIDDNVIADSVNDKYDINKVETEETITKDTENKIEVSEYDSFEDYISNITDDFNGETELKEIYTSDNLKYHLVVTSTNYLKHYKESGEVPKELNALVDQGIKLVNDFENGDDLDEYYEELKEIYNQLNNNIENN